MSSANSKPVSRTTRIHDQHIVITKDDHRNNERFLKAHPGTVVKGKTQPKHTPISKTPSVKKHKPDQKSHHKPPKTLHPKPKKNDHAKQIVDNLALDKMAEDEILQDRNIPDDDDLPDDDDDQLFAFHEVADEDYDLDTDYEIYDEVDCGTRVEGGDSYAVNDIVPPSNVSIDPATFLAQTDAKNGTVSFKASVNFDGGTDLAKYKIIVTQVTPK